MKRVLLKLVYYWERMLNAVTLRRKRVTYHKSVRIHGTIKVFGRGTIRIGKNVQINSKESANPGMGCYPKTVFHVPSGVLEIGDDTGMSSVAITCAERVSIGKHVLLGGGVKIMDTDAHSLDYTLRGRGHGIDIPVTKPVSIGDYAFIGANATILKGVSIGQKAIIGAGSVVTRSVPAGEIWAGNPAVKIGEAPNCR